MKKGILIICALVTISIVSKLHAQEDRNQGLIWSSLRGLEYEIKAGFNIGGTTPLPLPEEIRALTGYRPLINFSIEGNVTKWLDVQKKWGIIFGVRIENKGMEAEARVKNYSMEIIDGGSKLKGNWTGCVKTKVKSSYISIPVVATYKLNSRVRLNAGPYFSFLTQGDFSGNVFDGYLRKDNPTGTKVEFKDEKVAPYDFSDDLRTFQYGLQVGADWRAFKHLNVFGNLTWGLNDVFKKDFSTISFAMYPIYLNVGFGYAF